MVVSVSQFTVTHFTVSVDCPSCDNLQYSIYLSLCCHAGMHQNQSVIGNLLVPMTCGVLVWPCGRFSVMAVRQSLRKSVLMIEWRWGNISIKFYVSVCVFVCVHARTYTHTCTYIHTCIHKHTHRCMHAHYCLQLLWVQLTFNSEQLFCN